MCYKPCDNSSGVGTLKDWTTQATGLKAFTTCLITPSLPQVSIPCRTIKSDFSFSI
jgi:hypothetical protein